MSGLPAELERELEAFAAGRDALRATPWVTPLVGGLTNRSWRVRTRDVDWTVRLGGGRDGELAIDRRGELAALGVAAAAGLAPAVVHAAPERGALVLGFVPGHVWSRVDARQPANVARLAATLREVHALPVPPELPALDVRETIDHYLRGPHVRGPVPREVLAARAGRALADYAPGARVLCHHDPHHLNVVDAGRLVLLDWEYAGGGDPLLDLGAYSAYHDLDAGARAALLRAYGAPGRTADLERAIAVFDCLQALWYDASDRWRDLDAARRAALVARLASAP